MKRLSSAFRFLLSAVAAASLAAPVTSHATFIIDPDPGGEFFYIDVANKDVNNFSGHVGGNNVGPVVNVATEGSVNTGSGYANVKPATIEATNGNLLTLLTFTPADDTKYGDFSFRGQLVEDGDVFVTVIDQLGTPFNFTFSDLKANADFGRLGVISTDGEWIQSVSIFTGEGDSFKEVKQIDFSLQEGAPIPEPGTVFLMGAGLVGLVAFGKRRRNS